MGQNFIIDYFVFTLSSCLGVVILSLQENPASNLNFLRDNSRYGRVLGTSLTILSYLWFFGARDRNVHTVVEGTQLSFIFAISAVTILIISKALAALRTK